jgi:type IV pilus assembly protein PilE
MASGSLKHPRSIHVKNDTGFTLVELMVTILVIGILAGVAIPSYRSYMVRANRTEAKQALLARASDLERCFTRNNTYVNAAATPCGVVLPSVGTNYNFKAGTLAQTSFVLQAVPAGQQAKDTQCATFSLDDKGARGISGTGKAADCWGR